MTDVVAENISNVSIETQQLSSYLKVPDRLPDGSRRLIEVNYGGMSYKVTREALTPVDEVLANVCRSLVNHPNPELAADIERKIEHSYGKTISVFEEIGYDITSEQLKNILQSAFE